jgi:hypothetical protein
MTNHFCPADGCQLETTECGYICSVCGFTETEEQEGVVATLLHPGAT